MSPLEEVIRDEIAGSGPIRFHRFMELALYDPRHGYYRRGRDPFGASGDYFTAEQLQPVFGTLIAVRVRRLYEEMGEPREFQVVELGAGRGEMAEALAEFTYVPVDLGRALPERITGVVFANEFFDALPVDVAVRRGGEFHQMRVGASGGRFAWVETGPVTAEMADYLRRYAAAAEEGSVVEVNLDALGWVEEIARRLDRGFLFAIDYGYTARELVRFPSGTLMSYHRHLAIEDVLEKPGERDITAHAPFTAIEQHGAERGLEKVRFESLARTLAAAGEPDRFACVLEAGSERERIRRRGQLKTLLFGMGETFRTLLLKKAGPK